jgi:hypothetical protein
MQPGPEDIEQRRSTIRVMVPGIDADQLDALVKAKRSSFASSAATGATSPKHAFLQTVFIDIERRLDLADERSLPRTEIPKRLAAFQPLAPLFLRGYNYLTKSQREAAIEQTQALRAMLAILRALAGGYRD